MGHFPYALSMEPDLFIKRHSNSLPYRSFFLMGLNTSRGLCVRTHVLTYTWMYASSVCVCGCVCMHTCLGRKTRNALLCHTLSYPSEPGVSLHLKLGWRSASPRDPLPLTGESPGATALAFLLCDEHHDQNQAGEERVCFLLEFMEHCITKVSQTGQDPGGRRHGGMPYRLASHVCSACFLITPGPPAQCGVGITTVVGPFSHQSSARQSSTDTPIAYWTILWRYFLS